MSEVEVFDALRYRIEVDSSGTRWYYNSAGQLHRDDGPAVEWNNGTKSWYQNGNRHRTDGAAVEYANGYKEWFINGRMVSEADFNQLVGQYELSKMYLMPIGLARVGTAIMPGNIIEQMVRQLNMPVAASSGTLMMCLSGSSTKE